MYFDSYATGKRIQHLRKANGMTQEEMAIRLNISDRHLGKIERGEGTASIDLLVEVVSTLKDEDPSRRIVVLTVSDSGKDLTACIQAGADGYFLKDMEPEEFLKSIRRALEGQTVVDASMLAFLTTTLRAKMSSTLEERPTLTGREAEVLDLIAKGCTNKVIARRLDITEGTVKGHVKHLLKKLGCRSRVEAAVWAAQQKTAE